MRIVAPIPIPIPNLTKLNRKQKKKIWVMCHMSCVMCRVSSVTFHLTPTPAATITDPPPLSKVGWYTVGWLTVGWLNIFLPFDQRSLVHGWFHVKSPRKKLLIFFWISDLKSQRISYFRNKNCFSWLFWVIFDLFIEFCRKSQILLIC